jgi:hypothetical protein
MKAFAIHSADGDLVALVTCQPDASALALVADPGQLISEVEVPEGTIDLAGREGEQRVVEALQVLRVIEGRLVKKTS